MKNAIRYYTKSKKGNTKKLADAVSAALGIEALDVSSDLSEKTDRLFLINAMYAANIDKEVVRFLERNRENIGEIVNMNTSASGASTLSAVKKTADAFGIPVSEKEFHCAASWIFINEGLPTEEDLKRAGEFASGLSE
ncbi:MAG: flavodoxin [Clostridia bacterium]|nr:flavodoxin [Clostridia bacterium]